MSIAKWLVELVRRFPKLIPSRGSNGSSAGRVFRTCARWQTASRDKDDDIFLACACQRGQSDCFQGLRPARVGKAVGVEIVSPQDFIARFD